MKLRTRIFGEIEIDESKKLVFEQGIIGYPDFREFFLLYDIEKESDDECFALPVIDPLIIRPDYDPTIEDELLTSLGKLDDEYAVFTTIRVPSDITQMTINLKAPIVINVTTQKGCQVIVEESSYAVRVPVYDLLKSRMEKGETEK